MSGRHYNNDKGSSRSTRDDSRTWDRQREDHDARRDRETKWPSSSSRSRSRSPRQRPSPPPPPPPPLPKGSSYSPVRSHRQGKDYEEKTIKNADDWEDSDSEEEVPAPPPPPRISKISIGFSKPKAPIKMSLGGPSKSTQVVPKPTVASVFNDDDDEDDPEEMPAEARMRMRNIGRETPTSAGPNSFGKTKQGFCDAKKVFEKNLKEALDTAQKPPTMTKFPQTIYKIKGP